MKEVKHFVTILIAAVITTTLFITIVSAFKKSPKTDNPHLITGRTVNTK